MALSLAQRHKLRCAGLEPSQEIPAGSESVNRLQSRSVVSAQISVRLIHDLRHLKSIKSYKRKNAVKQMILPDYAPYIEGVLERAQATGQASSDEIVANVFIWRIDTGDYRGALEIARYLIRFDLPMPERFARDPAAILVTEIANAALKAIDLKQDFDPDILDEVDSLTAGCDMSDDMRAQLYKAQGLLSKDPERALKTLKAALDFNQNIGVKQQIRALEKQVSQLPPRLRGGSKNDASSDA